MIHIRLFPKQTSALDFAVDADQENYSYLNHTCNCCNGVCNLDRNMSMHAYVIRVFFSIEILSFELLGQIPKTELNHWYSYLLAQFLWISLVRTPCQQILILNEFQILIFNYYSLKWIHTITSTQTYQKFWNSIFIRSSLHE